MNELFDTYDLIQHVTKPTHNCGNTLDLIITRKTTKLFDHKVDEMLSDHHVLLMYFDMKNHLTLKTKEFKYEPNKEWYYGITKHTR